MHRIMGCNFLESHTPFFILLNLLLCKEKYNKLKIGYNIAYINLTKILRRKLC